MLRGNLSRLFEERSRNCKFSKRVKSHSGLKFPIWFLLRFSDLYIGKITSSYTSDLELLSSS